LLSKGQDA